MNDCRAFLEDFPSKVDDYEELLTDNPIFCHRTRGVGVMAVDQAVGLGVTGPLLRACGFDYDIRKKEPYLAYEEFDFEVPLGDTGAWLRCASREKLLCRHSRACQRDR